MGKSNRDAKAGKTSKNARLLAQLILDARVVMGPLGVTSSPTPSAGVHPFGTTPKMGIFAAIGTAIMKQGVEFCATPSEPEA
ncbi:MAG: hypothetical protein HYR84_17140 [Planctomycetes bacterium]|nr:hypothetical protein [Planctomycetota bacterium]